MKVLDVDKNGVELKKISKNAVVSPIKESIKIVKKTSPIKENVHVTKPHASHHKVPCKDIRHEHYLDYIEENNHVLYNRMKNWD